MSKEDKNEEKPVGFGSKAIGHLREYTGVESFG